MRSKPMVLVALLLAAFLVNLDTTLVTATMPAAVPSRVAAIAHQSVGAAYTAAGKIAAPGHPALGQALHHASTNAFLHGVTIGTLVAGSLAAAGALLAVPFLPAQPASPAAEETEPAEAAHEAETQTHPIPAVH